MASTNTAIWVFFVSYLTLAEGNRTCFDSQSFKRRDDLDNYSVSETPYVSKPVQHRFECCKLCSDNSQCLVFSYNNGECSEYNVSPLSANTAAPSFLYYSKDGDRCPTSSGYKSVWFPRLCYKLYDAPKVNWTTSITRCQTDGGRLIILNTAERHVHIVTVMNTASNNEYYSIWVGLHQQNGNIFVWTDNSIDTYEWDVGEPDYTSTQQCGKVVPTGLSDVECEDLNAYICEITLQ